MSFRPFPCPDRWHGILAMLGLFVFAGLLLMQVPGRPVDGVSFLLVLAGLISLVLIGYIGLRTRRVFTLEYWVDRDAVTLVWGSTRQIIPLAQIERIIESPTAQPTLPARPWHWPCMNRRRIQSSELGVVNAYATRPLNEQIVLVTAGESYSLSPADRQGFLQALQERFALGAGRTLQAELRRAPVWTWPLWRDRGALFLIGAGLLGVLVMFGVLCFRYPALSSDLPLHFDAAGLPDRIAPKSGLFALPVIGLLIWLLNTAAGVWLYRHVQQGAAYLLWGGALTVQGLASMALFILMRW